MSKKYSNVIRFGDYDTFYSVLEEALKETKLRNFILNDSIENFIYLKFLFENVNDIKVFVEDFDYLSDIYNKTVNCGDYKKCEKRRQVIEDFWESFKRYASNDKNHLQIVYKEYKGTNSLFTFEQLDEILSKDNSVIQQNVLRHDLSIVEGLNFFILVPKFKMVLTVQKLGDETFHVCQFYNDGLFKNAEEIYASFLNLSEEKSNKKQNDGE